jgi:hypothetical protein
MSTDTRASKKTKHAPSYSHSPAHLRGICDTTLQIYTSNTLTDQIIRRFSYANTAGAEHRNPLVVKLVLVGFPTTLETRQSCGSSGHTAPSNVPLRLHVVSITATSGDAIDLFTSGYR